jgi:alpha/beta superfamily hydrolase
MTSEKIQKILEDMGYAVYHIEYNDGDSDGAFQDEYAGDYIRFIVLSENEIKTLE